MCSYDFDTYIKIRLKQCFPEKKKLDIHFQETFYEYTWTIYFLLKSTWEFHFFFFF